MSVQAQDFISRVRGQLIVSCQVLPDSLMAHPIILSAVAQAVELGGASAVRADGAQNIEAMRRTTSLPIIGTRTTSNCNEIHITPRFDCAQEIALAGASMLAVQATIPRVGNCTPLPALVSRIHRELGIGVIADISTLAEAEDAMAAGVDMVATTLSGYTPQTLGRANPIWTWYTNSRGGAFRLLLQVITVALKMFLLLWKTVPALWSSEHR
jgi:N-acylglucosamine-6-phosphate 2-epimerase